MEKKHINFLKKILTYLKTTKRGHYSCEDSYYSCEKSAEILDFNPDHETNECTCGAEQYNARLGEIVESLKKEIERLETILRSNKGPK